MSIFKELAAIQIEALVMSERARKLHIKELLCARTGKITKVNK